MHISQAGIDLIKKFEGFSVEPYHCPAGVLTIGYGHTGRHVLSKKITEQEAEDILREDCSSAELCVINSVTAELKQHEFDALVSLVFNIGAANFKKSTLLRLLNVHDIGAADQFLRWGYAGKKMLPGLVKRRQAERYLFLGKASCA